MGMFAPMAKWIPQDDLLLKNAVEAGASLESLAKGAVQFSRRFTIQELQNRWYSLLYDLDASEDASTRFIEIEFQLSLPGHSKGSRIYDSKSMQTSFGKRKGQSVQSDYYAMRKRVCNDPCASASLDFVTQAGPHIIKPYASSHEDQLTHDNYQVNDLPGSTNFYYDAEIYEHCRSDAVVGDDKILSHVNDHVDFVEEETSHEKIDIDFLEPLSEDNLSSEIGELGNTCDSLCYLSPSLKSPYESRNEDKRIDSSCPGVELEPELDAGASETILDNPHISEEGMEFLNHHTHCHEDDNLLIGMDMYNEVKPSFVNIDSIFSSTYCGANEAVMPNSDQHTATEVSKTLLTDIATGNACNVTNASSSPSEVLLPSNFPESSSTTCFLNTEDQEIPCNDHVLLPLFCSSKHEGKDDFSSAKGFPLGRDRSVGLMTSRKQEQVKHLFQTCNHDKMDRWSLRDSTSYNVPQGVLPSHAEKISQQLLLPVPLKKSPTDDKEESFLDSGFDIPRFAEIEAMILDMDLDLYDQGSCSFTKEAARYQSDVGKKAIIRLELGARSFINRAISSRGALAVLYGRHLKYFMRKTKVVFPIIGHFMPNVSMGRATQETKVDIDLGREGRANKISRFQATIKMRKDGSFVLKNFGKHSIFVNGKEVATKSWIHLKSESLVEVMSMPLMFEVNETAVRRYVAKSHD
ncbi:hypothetical protein ZIOFF_021191 [Zingiber officinale]|uniref:FHA domain-containing protein n=1 Tax=Zingiber officinale TaxID=94328 RepID=A0A8J5H3H4_ZINOF|nr:hypothetical protein ZIOFF_021191 [Zingiber officinale]